MDKQRIYLEGTFSEINKEERITLCGLLIKAGYTVRIGRERRGSQNKYYYYVEYWRTNEKSYE